MAKGQNDRLDEPVLEASPSVGSDPTAEPPLPARWTIRYNPRVFLSEEDWDHLRKVEASGGLDFWLEEGEDIYDSREG